MNFNDLQNSKFYLSGRVSKKIDTSGFKPGSEKLSDEEHWKNFYLGGTSGFTPEFYDEKFIESIKLRDYEHYKLQMGVSLFAALDSNVPPEWREAIIDQWIEVTRINSKIPLKCNMRHFIIQPPGEPMRHHGHYPGTKCIFTLVYKFNPNPKRTPQSKMIVGTDKEYKIDFTSDKCYFIIKDNLMHHAVSDDEWLFFWASDYLEEFEEFEVEGFTPTQMVRI